MLSGNPSAYRFYTSAFQAPSRSHLLTPIVITQTLPQNKETHIFKSESLPDPLGLGAGLF